MDTCVGTKFDFYLFCPAAHWLDQNEQMYPTKPLAAIALATLL
jgi:hypothetical protein